MMLVGHYEMIAGILNSAGLTLEKPVATVLQGLNQRLANHAA